MSQEAKKFLAELIGTFALIFFGAGAILQQNATQSVGTTGIAVAHGMAILVGVYAFGHISGGHFNPAVTFGFLVTRRITLKLAFVYWVVQLAGAIAASLLVKWLFPGDALAA